ncbi:heterokaryon incompatibility protein-domain-containing protein [Lasiosphaeria hispida]|uniref:Heterokaryon incompatibility protein-domain-containing protein n=1 Tax=Lasiosphaeria hispida TaxID=260671 RepID=A0AAJ0HHH2_9PEZI|nr:heterokaryon incompatibility protein-domain-containing protein [Lasiosphaeria hispida]
MSFDGCPPYPIGISPRGYGTSFVGGVCPRPIIQDALDLVEDFKLRCGRSSRKHRHTALPTTSEHFRLVRPLGRDSSGMLEFSLEPYSFVDKTPPYFCLSYTWGNPFADGVGFKKHFDSVDPEYSAERKVDIKIDSALFGIQKNLHDALSTLPLEAFQRHFSQSSMPSLLLWIDAICIDQTNEAEKGQQVSMMDTIYRSAECTIIWLGPADDMTPRAIRAVEILSQKAAEFESAHNIYAYCALTAEGYEEAGIPFIGWDDWVALASFFQRQWFRRAWIVQEIIVSADLLMYCSPHLIRLAALEKAAKTLYVKNSKGENLSARFVDANNAAMIVEEPAAVLWNMRDRLHIFRQAALGNPAVIVAEPEEIQRGLLLSQIIGQVVPFLASEPRDKIFSLYGLLNFVPGPRARLHADYKSSVAQVYTDAAWTCITEAEDLHVLAWVHPYAKRRTDIPSWVPDFSRTSLSALPMGFRAARGLDFVPTAGQVGGMRLRLKGVPVAAVAEAPDRVGVKPLDKWRLDPAWFRLAASIGQQHEGREILLSEMLARTLCMDFSHNAHMQNMTAGLMVRDDHTAQNGPLDAPRASRNFGPRPHHLTRALDGFEKLHDFGKLVMDMIHTEADKVILKSIGANDVDIKAIVLIPDGAAYRPFEDERLASILADMETVRGIDGDVCWLPDAETIQWWYDNEEYTAFRLSRREDHETTWMFPSADQRISSSQRLIGSGTPQISSVIYKAIEDFTYEFQRGYAFRKLFTTETGLLGLGPVTARPGDEVWVVSGSETPLLLRRRCNPESDECKSGCDNDAHRFELVGAVYVHGIMNGEAVAGMEQNSDMANLVLV